MSLNAKDVAEILKALEASSFDSLELQIGEVKLALRRGEAGASAAARSAPRMGSIEKETTAPTGPGGATTRLAQVGATAPPVEAPPGCRVVPAPLLGVFYRAPKPGEPPFVEAGSRVAQDSIIGIIEVMKLMNTVRAGVAGEVVAIPARNGELVEFGEALLFVRPD